ncbi:hypothetical protein Q4Q35_08940 [Flavivirga aquimarina]|uniref:Uncharacterized protein n=1 Tax=Flavivirga aquimarina TaxID=2027862 RepID=A0ABT8W9W1_9FLAO|nr:hypothetical protein [Flavivirga aquimarina]MDO5969934.1 hypothetical protein [Flavivirga aquimarina]
MNDKQSITMKWVLFWVFIIFYIVITSLTILALFFDFGNLASNFKTPLFATFIVETGVGIIMLFYSLFKLKKEPKDKPFPKIDSEIVSNLEVVNDSPLGTEISLNKPVNLLESYKSEINSLLTSNKFLKQFNPAMMVFTSKDESYNEFRPTVVLQLDKNPLIDLNMTLSDYMDSTFSLTKDMQNIVGKRQVRVGTNIATQWYKINMKNVMGIKIDTDYIFTQFQKIVVSDDFIGIITISYGDETKPKDVKILQDLFSEFGIQ